MILKYLGTSAAEGWPALFCNCPNCKEASRRGGRDIRSRSQSLLDGHILLDFTVDTYYHKLKFGLDLSKIDTLIVTHDHADHFYPWDLLMRVDPYAHDLKVPVWDICSGKVVIDRINNEIGGAPCSRLHVLKAFETIEVNGTLITPIPASHMNGGDPFCYAIETGNKRVLYLHDTGEAIGGTLKKLNDKRAFDFISYDCCFCTRNGGMHGHMGLPNIANLRPLLKEIGLINENTVECVNHFSHNTAAFYDDMAREAGKMGMICSYDGLEVEF